MYAIVMAEGDDKQSVIKSLLEAITDLEKTSIDNCSAHNFEYEMFEGEMPAMDMLFNDHFGN